jgi:hypothetical protein
MINLNGNKELIMIELWIRDEYGQASIIDRSDDSNALLKSAMGILEDENFDNALTAEETEKNWSCYMPVSMDDSGDLIISEHLYSGSSSPGRCDFFNLSEDGSENRMQVSSLSVKMLVGKVDGNYVYVKSHKKKFIENLDDDMLRLKSFLFFKKK